MNFEKLKKSLTGLRLNEVLKQHCTFRVGGPADFFYEAKTSEDLIHAVETALNENIPYIVIGRGTNCIFTDKGYPGLIIKNMTRSIRVEGTQIHADSGVLWAQIINEALKYNLSGMEQLYGLPGSIGGAVWGNAGVPGLETGNLLRDVELFTPKKGRHTVDVIKNKKSIIFGYRQSSLQETMDIVISVTLQLKFADSKESKAQMKMINEARLKKQPIGFSAGSFFKNPSQDKPAGMLIEQAGIKGLIIGDAEISTKHGNFFINKGKATFADIMALRDLAVKTVQEKSGITLEMEPRIIGEL